MKDKRLFNIFIIVFIDLLGFGLILPLLPFYADQYDATPLVVGLLTASYAINWCSIIRKVIRQIWA